MLQDFQNEVLQHEWNKYRVGVLQRRQNRDGEVRLQQEQQQLQQNNAALLQRTQQLDSEIDTLSAKFSDLSKAVDFDVQQLGEKHRIHFTAEAPKAQPSNGITKRLTTTSTECLGPRAHVTDCLSKYKNDVRPCDAYIDALEACVSNVVVSRIAPKK
jgi:predicted nuclease with TOPRIM domain